MMSSDREKPAPSNDPLDGWLARAEFPSAPGESTERLRREWRTIWKTTPRSHGMLWVGAAVAAMICVTTAVGWKLAQSSQISRLRQMVIAESGRSQSTETMPPLVARVSKHSVTARAPTALEMRMLAVIERREREAAMAPKVVAQAPATRDSVVAEKESVDKRSSSTLLAAARDVRSPTSVRVAAMASMLRKADDASIGIYLTFAADPATKSLAMSAADAVNEPPTDALLRKLNDSHIATRMASAAVLGRIDGPETTRKLADLVLKNENRREALFALAASRGPEAKAFLDRAARTNELSSAVASTMIQTSYQ